MAVPERPWHFIVNPAAGGGRARRRWRTLLPRLRRDLPGMTFEVSTPATTLADLAHQAVRRGQHSIVSVGGDGTHHHILNALVRARALGRTVLAPLSLGSGNDWIRSLGTPRAYAPWLARLKQGTVRTQMVGRIVFEDSGKTHYFLNVLGMAYDADVVQIAAEEGVRGRLGYALLAAAYLKEYEAPSVELHFDGGSFNGRVHTINVGIGRNSGGGMSFVPHADPFGSDLALTYATRLPAYRVLLNSWRLYNGSIGSLRALSQVHSKTVRATQQRGVLRIEADGEYLGSGNVRIDILPERLSVLASVT